MIPRKYALSDMCRGTMPTHPDAEQMHEGDLLDNRAHSGALEHSQLGEQHEAGTIRVNGAPFIEKITGSL